MSAVAASGKASTQTKRMRRMLTEFDTDRETNSDDACGMFAGVFVCGKQRSQHSPAAPQPRPGPPDSSAAGLRRRLADEWSASRHIFDW